MYDTSKPYKKSILGLIRQTWETPYVTMHEGVYPFLEKKVFLPEVDHTDGLGTKGFYHWQRRTFYEAVADAMAMNLNDLAVAGAKPFKLQNHIVLPQDDEEAVEQVIGALVKECKARKIAITGGETSIHEGVGGLDVSITMSGFVEQPRENKFQAGDALFSLPSDGLHSNGFTKVRELFGKEGREEFVRPTAIYIDTITNIGRAVDIHGMMHITGGAFMKLKDLLDDADVLISRRGQGRTQRIFQEVYEKGVGDEEMYRTFNCGTGFVFSISKNDVGKIPLNTGAYEVGQVVRGQGRVKIESLFSDITVEL